MYRKIVSAMSFYAEILVLNTDVSCSNKKSYSQCFSTTAEGEMEVKPKAIDL